MGKAPDGPRIGIPRVPGTRCAVQPPWHSSRPDFKKRSFGNAAATAVAIAAGADLAPWQRNCKGMATGELG